MPSGIVRALVAVAVVVALGAAVATAQNDMPVIGILSMPLSATEGCVCEQTSYGSVVEVNARACVCLEKGVTLRSRHRVSVVGCGVT